MGKMRREDLLYGKSLFYIFWKSGSGVFLAVTIVFAALCLFPAVSGYDASEVLAFVCLFFCIAFLLSYVPPLICLSRVFEQERATGVRWRERTDFDKPKEEREWYLALEGGKFWLYQRSYITKIIRTATERETAGMGSSTTYLLIFENKKGKQQIIKFYSKSAEQDFRKWYQKRP